MIIGPLAAYLDRAPITRAEFAARIGVTVAALGRYIRGERIPRPEVMAAIQRETAGQVTAADFYASPEAPAAPGTGSEERAA